MNKPHHILCIETGTDTCSVALAADGKLVALRESHGERDHAARVAVYTDEVLADAGIAATALNAIAVSKGPGSYTGLRIGVSFAKGLCYGIGVPLIGVGSLESLCRMAIITDGGPQIARSVGWEKPTEVYLIPMIDARRMEVYGQVFDAGGTALTEPEAWIIDEGSLSRWRSCNADDELCGDNNVYIFGDGAEKCREALPWAQYIDVAPSARGMIPLAFSAFEAGGFENTAYFEPFYLKDFVVTTSRKKLF